MTGTSLTQCAVLCSCMLHVGKFLNHGAVCSLYGCNDGTKRNITHWRAISEYNSKFEHTFRKKGLLQQNGPYKIGTGWTVENFIPASSKQLSEEHIDQYDASCFFGCYTPTAQDNHQGREYVSWISRMSYVFLLPGTNQSRWPEWPN